MQGALRRPVILLAAGLLSVGAATAWAFDSHDWSGHVKGDPEGEVGFDVTKQHGVKKVGEFTVFHAAYTCAANPPGRSEGMTLTKSMRVHNDGTFSGKGEFVILEGDPSGRVEGKFANGKAKGSFKVKGELGGLGSDCRTGLQDWVAEKTSR